MGTTSAAAFTPMAEAMMMGDTVLLEDEVNPAMSAALDAGLEVMALLNHFFVRPAQCIFRAHRRRGRPQAIGRGREGRV